MWDDPGRVRSQIKTYCTVERNGTPDVAAASSQPDRRKSKFGLRHGIKLIELYAMTKSEFGFSTIPPRTSGGNVRSSVPLNSTVGLGIWQKYQITQD